MTTNDALFRFTQQENLSFLQLQPELNNVQWGEIEAIGTQVLTSLESQSQPNLAIDLSPLNYMGSAMVALIVRVWKATQAKDGKICVICPHEGVREVLKLAALDKVWPIVDNMEQACSTLGVSSRSGSVNKGGTSNGTGSSGPWVIVAILGVICAVLVAFVVNPDLLKSKNGKENPAEQQGEKSPEEPAALGAEEPILESPAPEKETAIKKETATKKETTEKTEPKVEPKKEPTPEDPASEKPKADPKTTPEKEPVP